MGRNLLGDECPEEHACGLLHDFETLLQKLGVSVVELNVVARGGSGLGRVRVEAR